MVIWRERGIRYEVQCQRAIHSGLELFWAHQIFESDFLIIVAICDIDDEAPFMGQIHGLETGKRKKEWTG